MQEIILHACQLVRIISWMCGDSIVMMDMSPDLVDMSYLPNDFIAHTEENELDKAITWLLLEGCSNLGTSIIKSYSIFHPCIYEWV